MSSAGRVCRQGLLAQSFDHLRLLAVTSAIVAILSFFSSHSLRLALFVLLPFVFFKMDVLFVLITPALRPLLFYELLYALNEIKQPPIFALIGWGLGRLAGAILKRPPAERR